MVTGLCGFGVGLGGRDGARVFVVVRGEVGFGVIGVIGVIGVVVVRRLVGEGLVGGRAEGEVDGDAAVAGVDRVALEGEVGVGVEAQADKGLGLGLGDGVGLLDVWAGVGEIDLDAEVFGEGDVLVGDADDVSLDLEVDAIGGDASACVGARDEPCPWRTGVEAGQVEADDLDVLGDGRGRGEQARERGGECDGARPRGRLTGHGLPALRCFGVTASGANAVQGGSPHVRVCLANPVVLNRGNMRSRAVKFAPEGVPWWSWLGRSGGGRCAWTSMNVREPHLGREVASVGT